MPHWCQWTSCPGVGTYSTYLFNKVVPEVQHFEHGEVLQVLNLLDAILAEVQLLQAGEHADATHRFQPVCLHAVTRRIAPLNDMR